MLNGQFTATGSSPSWYGMRGGFALGITIVAGSNSLTLEQEIDGTWYTVGSAKTTSGRTQLIAGVDYTAGALFRLTCGTFATGPVNYAVQGDIVGVNVVEDLGLIVEDTYLLESGVDSWLFENSNQWLLENA